MTCYVCSNNTYYIGLPGCEYKRPGGCIQYPVMKSRLRQLFTKQSPSLQVFIYVYCVLKILTGSRHQTCRGGELMCMYRRLFIVLIFLVSCVVIPQSPLIVKVCYGQNTAGTIQAAKDSNSKTANTGKSKKPIDPYSKEIRKSGDIVVISKSLADLIRKNNSIVFSKVAIQQRLDDSGKIAGYELVSIDRGSFVEKTGLRSNDLVTSVNGVLARDFNTSRESLEPCNRFDITVLRKGKTKKLIIEIQQSR